MAVKAKIEKQPDGGSSGEIFTEIVKGVDEDKKDN